MKGGDILNKNEVALELTKLVATQIKEAERRTPSESDYAKALAEAYNTIFDTIHFDKNDN